MNEKLVNRSGQEIKDLCTEIVQRNQANGARQMLGWHTEDNASLDTNADTTRPTSYYTHTAKDIGNDMPWAS